ncbi:RNA polymerase sigma factor [Zunongwangia sp. HGR-M22]|uniref:RNA polymerase sigma factor n=1 Tax=Zunongwangia sp. HGR-M22 TaxID=3015168 RepID=UPI0022DD4563|nr:sigma-70 family RNA polymerase sigma factor [Zunongwangia sp. HGR-M22]WBL24346.1 sigma-70 family RNA polymerase sigma factor [Zunongwangia sp. HGR-M22]
MEGEPDKNHILWKQIKKGNLEAFQKLYDDYSGTLISFALQYTTDKSLVEDALQDVFVNLYKYRKKLGSISNLRNYLFTAIRREIYKKLQQNSRVYNIEEGRLFDDEPSLEDKIISDEILLEQKIRLAKTLTTLSDKQQRALFLRFNENRSYEEIAAILDISIESSRTLIYRCLKEIRKKI